MEGPRGGAGGIATTLTVVGWIVVTMSVSYGLYVGGEALNQGAPLIEWAGPLGGFVTGVLLLGFGTLLQQVAEIKNAVCASEQPARPAGATK
jgi:uncharacterized membrane protein